MMTYKEEEQTLGARDPYSIEKIFGVAALGAVTTVGLYFLYHNLSEENKQTVKDSLVSGFRAAVRL